MRAGKLRHTVTVQSQATTVDSYGGQVIIWDDVADVKASIEPLQGRELVTAQALHAETTVRITMRYHPDINTTCRVVHNDINYNLLSVLDPELKHRELICMASIGLSEG